jgi:hypothetical protein
MTEAETILAAAARTAQVRVRNTGDPVKAMNSTLAPKETFVLL